jgi:hypothetical protein
MSSLKFLTSLLLLTLTVVTSVPGVAGYLLFQASCCCSLLLQEPCCCKAAYLAIQLLLTSLLCELWFLLLQVSCCCRCPAVAGVLLLQVSCCCKGPAVSGVLLLQVSCCCRGPAVAGTLLSWSASILYSLLFKYTNVR